MIEMAIRPVNDTADVHVETSGDGDVLLSILDGVDEFDVRLTPSEACRVADMLRIAAETRVP